MENRLAEAREAALRRLCDAVFSDDGDADLEDRAQTARMLAAEMLDILNGPRPLPDHDNHHNAAACPYCTGNGVYVLVKADDVRHLMLGTREQQDEAMGKLLVALGMED